MRKRIATVFAALAVALVGLTATPVTAAPAAAAIPFSAETVFPIFSAHYVPYQCLDASTSNGVRLQPCNESTFQQWFTTTGRDLRLNRYDGTMCLDASTSNGVRLRTCDGSTFQQWYVNGDELRLNRYDGTMCLDGSLSNGVRLRNCDGSDFQRWWSN